MASIEITKGFNNLEVEQPTLGNEVVEPVPERTIEEPTELPIVPEQAPIQTIPGFNNLSPEIKGGVGINDLQGDNSLDKELTQDANDNEALELIRRAEERQRQLEAETKSAKTTPEEQTPEEAADPLGVRIFNDIYSGAQDFGKEAVIGTGLAIANTLKAADELAVWLNEQEGSDVGPRHVSEKLLGKEGAAELYGDDIATPENPVPTTTQAIVKPDAQVPNSVTAGIIRGMTEFTVGFIPALKGIRLLSGGTAIAAKAPWIVGTIRGMLGSTSAGVTFDPHEDRLSNLLSEWEQTPELVRPIFEYLAADKEDTNAEGRLKTALEASGLNIPFAVAGGFIKSLKVIKYNRQNKGIVKGLGVNEAPTGAIPSIKEVTTTRTVPEGVQPNSKEFWLAEANKNQEQILNLTKQLDELGSGPIKDQTPKVTLKDGTVLTGKPGQGHAQVLMDHNVSDLNLEGAQAGWVNEASAAVKSKVNELYKLKQEAEEFVPVYQEKIAKAKTSVEIAESKATVSTKEQTHSAQGPKEGFAEIEGRLGAPAQGATRTQGFLTKEGQFLEKEAAKEAAYAEQLAKVPALKFAGRPGKDFVDTLVYQEWVQGKASLNKLLDTINIGSIQGVSNINEALAKLGSMVKLSAKKELKAGVDEVEKIAKRLGLTPDQFRLRNPELVAKPEQLKALDLLMKAARRNIRNLGSSIATDINSAANADSLYAFLRSVNVYKALNKMLQSKAGDVRQAEAIIAEMPVVRGQGIAQESATAQALLARNGGASKARRIAAALEEGDTAADFDTAIKDSVLKQGSDILVEYWYASLLSNITTHAVNIGSTAANLLYQVPVRGLSAQINRFLKSPEGVQVGEAQALMYGAIENFSTALRAAYRTARTGKSTDILNKLEDAPRAAWTSDNFGVDNKYIATAINGIGTALRIPTRGLLAEDEFFKVLARGMEINAQAVRIAKQEGLYGRAYAERVEAIKRNPDQFIVDNANRFAREVTFTDELGQIGKSIQHALRKGGIFGRLILPFVRTPINLFKQAQKNSIAAPISISFWKQIGAGGARAQTAMSKFMMGAAIQTVIYKAAINDMITGAGPSEPGLQQTWRLSHAPFSFKLPKDDVILSILKKYNVPYEETSDGARWISYKRIDPLALIFGSAASAKDVMAVSSEEDWAAIYTQAAWSMGQSITDKTFFQSISGFAEFAHDPSSRGGYQWLEQQLATMAVPAAMAGATRQFDPIWRETNGITEAICSRYVGCSASLPARRNIWGQAFLAETLGPDWISPFYQYVPDGKPINQWLLDNQVPLQMPSKVQMGVELDPHQYEKFVMLAGNDLKIKGMGLYDTLNAIMEGKHQHSGAWNLATDGPDGGRALIVRNLITAYRSAAQKEMLRIDPVFRKQVRDTELQKGYNLKVGPGTMPGLEVE